MKHLSNFVFILISLSMCNLSGFAFAKNSRQRVIVTTDLGGTDPDDTESLIHLLVCSDIIDIEGLISSQVWSDYPDKVDSIKKVVDKFCEVLPNLKYHSKNYPDAAYLKSIIRRGQQKSNMEGVGPGKDSPGSELIIACADKKDPRPLWIIAWGGMNNLSQAICKVRDTRTEAEFSEFISKIRIYDILGQDDAGAWIAHHYPEILYIRNEKVYGWTADDEWLRNNIMNRKPLGDMYPMRKWACEGDSPSFLYLLDNGLNVPEHIDYGGWGGRFDKTARSGIRGMDFIKRSGKNESKYDPYYMYGSSEEGVAAIRRWKEHIWNDFAARMIWSTTSKYIKANHHPKAIVNGESSTSYISVTHNAGDKVIFDASQSFDPDGNNLTFKWYVYKEPSTCKEVVSISGSNKPICSLTIPDNSKDKNIHLILEVTDDGQPTLTAYRRIVIHIQ